MQDLQYYFVCCWLLILLTCLIRIFKPLDDLVGIMNFLCRMVHEGCTWGLDRCLIGYKKLQRYTLFEKVFRLLSWMAEGLQFMGSRIWIAHEWSKEPTEHQPSPLTHWFPSLRLDQLWFDLRKRFKTVIFYLSYSYTAFMWMSHYVDLPKLLEKREEESEQEERNEEEKEGENVEEVSKNNNKELATKPFNPQIALLYYNRFPSLWESLPQPKKVAFQLAGDGDDDEYNNLFSSIPTLFNYTLPESYEDSAYLRSAKRFISFYYDFESNCGLILDKKYYKSTK